MSSTINKKDRWIGCLIFWGMIPLIIFFEIEYYENNGQMDSVNMILSTTIGCVICGIVGFWLWKDKQ